jgi:ligand-binding sensor domain-containing protein
VYSRGGKSLVKVISQNVDDPTTLLLRGTSLYVGDAEKSALSVFNVTNGKLISTLSQDVADPVSLAIDSSGTLYVDSIVYYNEGFISVFSNGKFSHEITEGIHGPASLAVDKAQNLYVTNALEGYNSIAVYAKGDKIPNFHIRKGIASPSALAIDSENNLYVCNGNAHDVTVYTNGSTSPSRKLITAAYPSAIVLGKNGSVYVASYNANEVDIFGPGATNPTVVIPSAYPSALTVDGQNNLYVANSTGIGVYDATTGTLQRTLSENVSETAALAFGN